MKKFVLGIVIAVMQQAALANASSAVFQNAICDRDLSQIKSEISNGQDLNIIFVDAFGKGHTPLTLALAPFDCSKPVSFELVSLLVENGADVNKRADIYERATPLMEAVRSLELQSVEYLLQKGADADMGDATGRTPLMTFADDNSEIPLRIVEALLNAGADPHARSASGLTAELWANQLGRKDISELIRITKMK